MKRYSYKVNLDSVQYIDNISAIAEDLLKSSYIQKIISNSETYNALDVNCSDFNDLSKYILNLSNPPIDISNYTLHSIELHQLDKTTPSIPLHQDGFYHWMKGNEAIKFLIPLTKMNFSRGGIRYLSISSQMNIFNHISSNRCNFSSVIRDSSFIRSNFEPVYFDLNIGDMIIHNMNSLHFSIRHHLMKPIIFVVLRYELINAKTIDAIKSKYNDIINIAY